MERARAIEEEIETGGGRKRVGWEGGREERERETESEREGESEREREDENIGALIILHKVP